MSTTRKVFVTSMIAGAGAVSALLLSPAASAEPAPVPTNPGVPALPFANQLAGIQAAAPQLIQGLASAFTAGGSPAAAPAAVPAAPAAVPAAPGATVTLPQLPAVSPAAAAAPVAAAATPGTTNVGSLIPEADVNLPQVAGLNLPQQLAFPADLASLMPANTPLAGLLPKATTAVPGAAAPAAAAPVASALPGAAGLMPMLLPTSALSALP